MYDLQERKYRKIEQSFSKYRECKEKEIEMLTKKSHTCASSANIFRKQRDKIDQRLQYQEEGISSERKLVKQQFKSILLQLEKVFMQSNYFFI